MVEGREKINKFYTSLSVFSINNRAVWPASGRADPALDPDKCSMNLVYAYIPGPSSIPTTLKSKDKHAWDK